MLIVYDRTTGEVVDNTGTNSVTPEGPTGDAAYINTDARGVARASLDLLRLHDERDAELVGKVLKNYHHVDVATGRAVIDGPYPTMSAEPATIPADGATPAVVTYSSGQAPTAVTFDVNGATVTEAVTDDTATIEVVTTTPGPVTVTCEGLTVTIDAVEGTK